MKKKGGCWPVKGRMIGAALPGRRSNCGGCRYFFGDYTSERDLNICQRLPEVECVYSGGSEIASINMLLGAASAGARAMTSSSGPGISLMQEGLSYMAGSAAGADCQYYATRPGWGDCRLSGDYWQATRGSRHSDYRLIVLANSVQEMYDRRQSPSPADSTIRYDPGRCYPGAMKEPITLSPRNQISRPSPGRLPAQKDASPVD